MSCQKPFEISRWDAPQAPDRAFLLRSLEREGLKPVWEEYPPGAHTPEVTFATPVVKVLVSGTLQYSLPGYGVVELHPGDRLDLQAEVRHDVIVSGASSAWVLSAANPA